MDGTKIGERLRKLRGDRPMKEVAKQLGITQQAVSNYEHGLRIPRDEIKRAYAQHFGVSIEEIFYT